MNYEKVNRYDSVDVRQFSMGPNPLKLLEELLTLRPIQADETVLDLGCGQGLTSLFLARETGARVFAGDLWIAPTENQRRFDRWGLPRTQVIPLKTEAHDLPFPEEYFDIVVSVDAYHYFGLDRDYLGRHLLPLVKRGGHILIAVPGLIKDCHENLPAAFLRSWTPEDMETFHDCDYWRSILAETGEAEILHLAQMESLDECWDDWLASDNPYAVSDRKAMSAGAGAYMNFIAMLLERK